MAYDRTGWKRCRACGNNYSYSIAMMRCEDCGFSDYRNQVADDMFNEPLQNRRGSQVWYPGQKEAYYRPKPPRPKPELPPMSLNELKSKMLKVNNYSLSSGGGHYLIEEDGVGPDDIRNLRPKDFEQFVIDLKEKMEELRRRIAEDRASYGGFYGRRWGSLNNFQGDTMPKVIVVHDAETASYDIKFEYKGNAAWDAVTGVIAVIKATIPVSDRAYDPGTNIWSVAEKYWPALKELLEHSTFQIEESKKLRLEDFFYEAPAPAGPTRSSLGDSICKLLGVTSDVLNDDAALKKAYRKKALELHPDKNNGDGSRMSELNSIWSQYNER